MNDSSVQFMNEQREVGGKQFYKSTSTRIISLHCQQQDQGSMRLSSCLQYVI